MGEFCRDLYFNFYETGFNMFDVKLTYKSLLNCIFMWLIRFKMCRYCYFHRKLIKLHIQEWICKEIKQCFYNSFSQKPCFSQMKTCTFSGVVCMSPAKFFLSSRSSPVGSFSFLPDRTGPFILNIGLTRWKKCLNSGSPSSRRPGPCRPLVEVKLI